MSACGCFCGGALELDDEVAAAGAELLLVPSAVGGEPKGAGVGTGAGGHTAQQHSLRQQSQ